MKRLILLSLVLACTYSLYSQGFKVSAGIDGGFNYLNLQYKKGTDPANIETQDTNDYVLGFGGWLDLTYGRLSVDYTMSIGGSNHSKTVFNGVTVTETNTDFPSNGDKYSSLLITAIGKFPFNFGNVAVFPELGAAYRIMLTLDHDFNGVDDLNKNNDMNDFFVVGGAGVNILLKPVILTLEAQFGYDLTPIPTTASYTSDISFSSWYIMAKLGVGVQF